VCVCVCLRVVACVRVNHMHVYVHIDVRTCNAVKANVNVHTAYIWRQFSDATQCMCACVWGVNACMLVFLVLSLCEPTLSVLCLNVTPVSLLLTKLLQPCSFNKLITLIV